MRDGSVCDFQKKKGIQENLEKSNELFQLLKNKGINLEESSSTSSRVYFEEEIAKSTHVVSFERTILVDE